MKIMEQKNTINITRNEAIKAIMEQMNTIKYKSNKELEAMLYKNNFGDDIDLKWYGHNFIVNDK